MRFSAKNIYFSWKEYYNNNLFLRKFTGVLSIDILVKASGFILIPVYLKLMSQDEFGLYNYLVSIVQTLSLVLNLGLYVPQSKLYHSLKDKKQRGQLLYTIVSTLLLLYILISLTFIIFGWDSTVIGFLFKDSASYKNYRPVILSALPISVISFMLTNFFYTSEEIRQVKAYNIYRIVFVNLLVLIGLYYINLDKVGIRLYLSYGVELVLLGIFGRLFLKEMIFVFSSELLVKSLKLGLPIMVSALFGIIINFSDKFFLEKYGSLKDLSIYYLTFSFASFIPLMFTSVQNLWLPIFIKENDLKKNIVKSRKLMNKLFFSFSGLAFLVWVLVKFLLWRGVIPDKYNQVLIILPILLITQIVTCMSTLFSNYLIYFEKTNFVSYSGLLVSIISLTLGLLLIPKWGIYGAAVSSLLSNITYLIAYYFFSLTLKRKYLKSLAAYQTGTYECT